MRALKLKLSDYTNPNISKNIHALKDKLEQQKGKLTQLESSIIRTNMAKDRSLYTKYMNLDNKEKRLFQEQYMKLFDFYSNYMIHNMQDFKNFFKTQHKKDMESLQS